MAEIYAFVFTKEDVQKEEEIFQGWNRERVEKKLVDENVEHKTIHETDELILVVVKDKPEEEETTRLALLSPTMFCILQDSTEVLGQISEIKLKGNTDKGNEVELDEKEEAMRIEEESKEYISGFE
jgi:hypothetical protein